MDEKYLILNGGSSSLKFKLYVDDLLYVSGSVERIGEEESEIALSKDGVKKKYSLKINTHEEALENLLEVLRKENILDGFHELKGIGHRLLHGGEFYKDSVLITDEVINNIESIKEFGPLHIPGELAIVKYIKNNYPNLSQVVVFDTAFHQTMAEDKFRYAVPNEWYYDYGVRKYGFHGTSHKYITGEMKKILNKNDVNLIICHLGNGSSISAIKDSKVVNTSMGLTPLDGLIMGTRSGSIDPSIIAYICKMKNLSVEEVTELLNKNSGLTGICGKNDLRDILRLIKENDENAKLAFKMLTNSIVNYIAMYYFLLEGDVDAIVFTAGIGENNPKLRSDVLKKVSHVIPMFVNNEMNDNISRNKKYQSGLITTPYSKVKAYVLKTDEEKEILQETKEVIASLDTLKRKK